MQFYSGYFFAGRYGLPARPDPADAEELLAHLENGMTISSVEELVTRLYQDLSFFPWLTTRELEAIAQIDIVEMKTVFPDEKFLEFLQDLSLRYLQNRERSSR